MSPKAEYWTLTKQQFDSLKSKIKILGEKILDSLQHEGFTKIESYNDWLGLTVEKKQEDILIFVAFALNREDPIEFELVLRKWNIKNPPGTTVDLYEKTFSDIEEFETAFDSEMEMIKEKLT